MAIFFGWASIMALSHTSENPVFLSYSVSRLILIAVLVAATLYAGFSAFRHRLAVLNVCVAVSVFAALATVEISMRGWIEKAPAFVVPHLPENVRREWARETGNFTEGTIQGSGLRYFYPPYRKIPAKPYLIIDKYGYRNSIDMKKGQNADVILLGDSVTIADQSSVDLGHMFRERGWSAFNFGMGGYGAPHYPLVFEELVAANNVSVRYVVVGICMVNDISNTKTFDEVEEEGGDYRAYLGARSTPNGIASSWAIGLARNLVLYLKDVYWDKRHVPKISNEQKKQMVYVDLDNDRFEFPRARLSSLDDWPPGEPVWESFIDSLREVAEMARRQGAQRIIYMMMPGGIEIYDKNLVNFRAEADAFQAAMAERRLRIFRQLDDEDVSVLDMTPVLRRAAERANVSADRKIDYHLNEWGIEAVFEALSDEIARIDQEVTR